MNRSELLAFLERIDRRPNKALSQNFLIDQNIVKKIVRTADVQSLDPVLEIGPGPGALTSALLEVGANVYAVEKYIVLAQELTRLQTPDARLHVFAADILNFDFTQIETRGRSVKVVANLPYHITTPILEKILASRELFSSLTIMIQSEVADRILARHGSKAFSSLALFMQFHTRYVDAFKVPASCFYPSPKVDSTVIRMDLSPIPFQDEKLLFSVIRRAFQQRRKMISSSLKLVYPQELIHAALVQAFCKPTARPEELSLEQWIKFVSRIKKID